MDCLMRTLTDGDYGKIIRVVDEWWGGRKMADMLPRLFFTHFSNTSFILEAANEPVAFLCGFVSPAHPEQAYIHFVGVHPKYRNRGLARKMYQSFFTVVGRGGCREVHCVTSPVNKGSIAFHKKMGFQIRQGDREEEGISLAVDYDGPGQDRVLFVRNL